ncbi:hypothetical protein Tco_1273996 [Tanacetum coccineum]
MRQLSEQMQNHKYFTFADRSWSELEEFEKEYEKANYQPDIQNRLRDSLRDTYQQGIPSMHYFALFWKPQQPWLEFVLPNDIIMRAHGGRLWELTAPNLQPDVQNGMNSCWNYKIAYYHIPSKVPCALKNTPVVELDLSLSLAAYACIEAEGYLKPRR